MVEPPANLTLCERGVSSSMETGLVHLSMSGYLPVPTVQSKGCVGSQVKLVSWGDRAAKWTDWGSG